MVLHHGREEDDAGHDEARPTASTACWPALIKAFKGRLLQRSSDLVGESVDELVYPRERHAIALVDEQRVLAVLDLDERN